MSMEPSPRRGQAVESNDGFDIVLMAASAGGLAALSSVLGVLPQEFPLPVVVVQHLDPRHRSLMAEILERRTPLRVEEADEGMKLLPSTVYIAPPNEHLLVVSDGSLTLSHSELVHFVRPSADLLFESGAAAYPGRTIGVVLTGTGSDGNMGVRAIAQTGGTVIAQDPQTAQFAAMPQAAIDTGGVNFVLRSRRDRAGPRGSRRGHSAGVTEQEHDVDAEQDTAGGLATEPEDLAASAFLSDPAVDEDLEALLGFIRDARGFDFTGYKRSSVGRRVRRRMQELGYESIAEYQDFLEADADEFTALFNTILINLTGFFRDAGSVEVSRVAHRARDRRAPCRGWSDPGLERGLCDRRGGLHVGHDLRQRARRRGHGAPRQDLRHRHRPRRSGAGAPRRLLGAIDLRCARAGSELLLHGRPPGRVAGRSFRPCAAPSCSAGSI